MSMKKKGRVAARAKVAGEPVRNGAAALAHENQRAWPPKRTAGVATRQRTASTIDKAIGLRVRQRRLSIGMSQERLAELLGVTFQQVQKYEKGVNRIAASRLLDIARSLEMPIVQFYEGLDDQDAATVGASDVERALATAEGQKLISLFAAIPSVAVRKRIVALAEAVARGGD